MLPGISLLLGLGGLLVATATSGGNARNNQYATFGIAGFNPELEELCMDVFKRNIYNVKDPCNYAPSNVPPGWYEKVLTLAVPVGGPYPKQDEPDDDHPVRWRDYMFCLHFSREWEVKLEYIRWLAREKGILFNEEQASRYVRMDT